ncbi:MAG: uridine kinase [Gemmatimonadota bacterium]|nr:MAG: uridine kinase [Gemmatimonadota bacterium]
MRPTIEEDEIGGRRRPLLVGVAGGSGAGKTTVVNTIVHRVGRKHVSVIQHDAYYHDRSSVPPEERSELNYDHPDSLDTALLIEHLRALAAGRTVRSPAYDFTSHTRAAESVLVEPRRIVIVEGILILADEALRELLDVKVFVDTDPDIRIIRRLERDMGERGRTHESVIRQYLRSVRPMHLAFVEPSKAFADVVIEGSGPNDRAIDSLIEKITSVLEAGGIGS